MIHKFLLHTIFLFSTLIAFSQTDTGENMQVNLIKVSNKIYMLQAKGGNIGLSFGNDGVFMVDSQYADGVEQILKEIKKISGKKADSTIVEFLVNTHLHEDHVGGNVGLAKNGTLIFAHENTRKRLEERLRNDKRKIPESVLPIITFSEKMTFHYNNEDIQIFHAPTAHTDGDALVFFSKSNVLHTGDLLFNGKYPFIDTENGGSLMGVVSGLEKALAAINENTKIIPGHGNIGNSKDLQTTIDMLINTYKKVATLYIATKTEDEVAQMKDLTREYDAQNYGDGFISTEAFLRMVYKEVGKERGDFESNAEKNRKAREKVKQMEKEYNKKNSGKQ